MNSRRRSILLFMGAVAASPWSTAQQRRMPVVGYIGAATKEAAAINLAAFQRGMRELGYDEGRNLHVEERYGNGVYGRLHEVAAELVAMKVDVLLTGGTPSTEAAHKATTSIPIVALVVGDPVGLGFAASLARPGGNITGITNRDSELGSKRLQLLNSLVPTATRIAFLVNPDNPNYLPTLRGIRTAARRGLEVIPVSGRSAEEIERTFADMKRNRIDGMLVVVDPLMNQQVKQVATLAIAHRLPAVGGLRIFAEAGGLAIYGENLPAIYARGAVYVDRILKGANPANMPIDQSSKIDFVLNARTARLLNINLPDSLRVGADEVID